MPVYLLHGFQWPRQAIRIHIILQNLDDAAAEWLVAPATSTALLENFKEIYPDCMEHLPGLRFIEQYDPEDTSSSAASQAFAYVADVCVEVKLGVDVDEVRGRGVPNDQWTAMMELRDKLAGDAKLAWYVAVCGDEERWAPGLSASSESLAQEGSTGASQNGEESSDYAPSLAGNDAAVPEVKAVQEQQQPRGLKKLLSTIGIRKSRSNLASSRPSDAAETDVPALPEDGSPKHSPSATAHSTRSAGAKANRSISDETRPLGLLPDKLTTRSPLANVKAQASFQSLSRPGTATLPHSADDHEIITGPQSDDDDDLAAPAPTIKHGKQQDLVSRQRKRKSLTSFAAALRGSPIEDLKHTGPLQRAQPAPYPTLPFPESQPPLPVQQLQEDDLHDEAEDEQPVRSVTPPASYVPTGAPSSIRTSRSPSPGKASVRGPSSSRSEALDALEGAATVQPIRTARVKSKRSTNLIHATPNARHSQYSLSSMSGTMAQLYGAHDRESLEGQRVTQDQLLAKGLDSMDFTALR